MLLSILNNGDPLEAHRLSEDMMSSTCSTPYVSAPSSPGNGHGPSGYFFSAPASPLHFVLPSKVPASSSSLLPLKSNEQLTSSGSFEFEFSSRFSPTSSAGKGSMSSADELFLNGQIRPMKLSSHLQRPQFLTPLLDYEDEDGNEVQGKREVIVARRRDLTSRNRSFHRKARSLSPFRIGDFARESRQFFELENNHESNQKNIGETEIPSIETTPSGSATSSRSSSSGRNSKKWIFLKDFLYRSKSEGRGNITKEKFWSSISLSASLKEKKLSSPSLTPSSSRNEKEKAVQNQKRSKQPPAKKTCAGGKPANGVWKRRVPVSAHELHYTTNRAQAEEMKRKTYLPYRQGMLGCLGFSSKSYGAFSGFARTLNPVSSR